MKRIFTKGRLIALVCFLSLSFSFSCTKSSEDDNDNVYSIMGNASGLQEIPANSSPASATLLGTYNAANHTLEYNISWKDLTGTATSAFFHRTDLTGDSAIESIEILITSNGIDGLAIGTLILPDEAETALLSGTLCYDLHTSFYPHGEIRGEILALQE